MTFFNLTSDERGRTLALFFENGDSETIPETHVSFQAILDGLLAGTMDDQQVRELTRVLETVATKMQALSERVSVDGLDIYFDGDALPGELGEVIKSLFKEGNTDFKPLVNFLEKAKTNPSLDSVDGLYRWIKNGDLVIDPDGDIVAYKGVTLVDGVPHSVHSGTAWVDGVKVEGQIPNVPGTVITMPRSEVDDGSHGYCATGLHIGTHSFAKSFVYGGLVQLVKFNPRDIVSVPSDASSQKIRVCRYTVLGEAESRLASALYKEKNPIKETTEVPAAPAKLASKHAPKQTTVTAQSNQSYRDPKTGRFVKGGNAPRDPQTGRFLKGI